MILIEKKLCKCCDYTENSDGVCDTCRLLSGMDKQSKFKIFLKYITSWGFIVGFIIGFILMELIAKYLLKW
jgi:hypothetical protein